MIREHEKAQIEDFIQQQAKFFERGLEVVSYESPPAQRFEALLRERRSGEEFELEVTGMDFFAEDESSYEGAWKSFEGIKTDFLELAQKKGYGQGICFRVKFEDMQKVRALRHRKRPAALLSILENKRHGIITSANNPPGRPSATFGAGTHDISGEVGKNFHALRMILESESQQFSDVPGRKRIILIENKYFFGDIEELQRAANKLIDRDKIVSNVDEIYLYDREGYQSTDKIQQVYPNSEGVEKILEVYVEDDTGEELIWSKGRELTMGTNGEILSIKPIGGER